jgi:hypothetical protein
LLFGQKGFMGMFPQPVQENGLVGSRVNRLTAGANPSTRSRYADAATSRTASVAHAGRRAVAAVVPASANGQYREQRS